ncbi:MAG: hypothetical protein R3Y04_07170 [Rikenellaceae bacterium]
MNNLKILSLAVITTATVLFSCTNVDSELGVGYVPESELMNVDQITFTDFENYTLSVDSVPTSPWGATIIGSLVSPYWGKSNYSFMATYVPYTGLDEDLIWGTNPVVDSVKLILSPVHYVGEESMSQIISVYELSNPLPGFMDSVYYSNFDPTGYVKSDLLTKITIADESTYRVDLPLEFGTQFLDTIGGHFYSDSLFILKYPGLYFETPEVSSLGVYRIIDLLYSGIEIYYRDLDVDETDVDTAFFSMSNDSYSANVSLTMINHDFSLADPIFGVNSKIVDDTLTSQEVGFVFAQSGLKTKINLNKSNFDNLKDSIEKAGYSSIAISNATLTVPINNATPSLMDTSLNRLGTYLSYEEIIGTEDYEVELDVQEENDYYGTSTTTHYNGYISRENKCYTINLTSHIQMFFTGELEDYEIEIAPESQDAYEYKGAFLDTKNITLQLTYVMIK